MSDLFCPATLIVARHGAAAYDLPDVPSDDGGCLTLDGRAQARALAESLRERRIAAIWCSDMARAVQTAEIVAGSLDVPVRVRSGLREFSVGDLAGQPGGFEVVDAVWAQWVGGDLSGGAPGAETGLDVLRRVSAELESLADVVRGENVLVVSHGGVIGMVLPRLASNVPADYGIGRPLANCGTCELTADADGWLLHTWNSRSLGADSTTPTANRRS